MRCELHLPTSSFMRHRVAISAVSAIYGALRPIFFVVTAWRTFRALFGVCRLNPYEPYRHCVAGVLVMFLHCRYGRALLGIVACFARVREKPGSLWACRALRCVGVF